MLLLLGKKGIQEPGTVNAESPSLRSLLNTPHCLLDPPPHTFRPSGGHGDSCKVLWTTTACLVLPSTLSSNLLQQVLVGGRTHSFFSEKFRSLRTQLLFERDVRGNGGCTPCEVGDTYWSFMRSGLLHADEVVWPEVSPRKGDMFGHSSSLVILAVVYEISVRNSQWGLYRARQTVGSNHR